MPHGQLLIIRHAESEKNVAGQFDGDPTTDQLTQSGRRRAEQIGAALREKIGDNSNSIYIANSSRAKQTYSAMFGFPESSAEQVDEFGSMQPGPYAGMNDPELRLAYPEFFRDLQLFRAGLLSGYSIRSPAGSDSWREFELRTTLALDRIELDPSNLKIIICHRSAMMTLLVALSRRLAGYPSGYFGFVTVPPLACALVTYDSDAGDLIVDEWEIVMMSLLN